MTVPPREGPPPAAFAIYSVLAFYGDRRGGELPGLWLVRALASVGLEENTVRQALYRLESQGGLEARRVGRHKLYAFTPAARASIEPGTRKIFAEPARAWDGAWSWVRLELPTELRVEENRLTDVLEAEGFAPLDAATWVHPHDRTEGVATAAREHGVERAVLCLRGRLSGGAGPERLVRLWDLASVEARYRAFLTDFGPLVEGAATAQPDAAFALRIRLVRAFLRVAWDDPELPGELLPEEWTGPEARRVARSLYDVLTEPALDFGDALIAEIEQRSARVADALASPSS